MRAFFNVLGIIAATLLSFVLIAVLITAPIWQGFSGLLKPDVLEKTITSIDLAEVVAESSDLQQALIDEGIAPEAIESLLSSNTFDEVVALLSKDALQVTKGQFSTTALTADELQDIFNRNKAEIVSLARQFAPETNILTDDQLGRLLETSLPTLAPTLISEIDKTLLDLQTDLEEEGAAKALQLAAGPIVIAVMLGTAFVLAVLIFLCRLRNGEGLIWLGVDSILAALPVLLLGIGMKSSMAMSVGTAMLPQQELMAVLLPVLSAIGTTILIGGAVLLALGIVLIAGFVLLRDRRLKKQRAAATPSMGEIA
ncbi:MAG: DUF2627 family protein [Oscillospiraceae bacterium]|nr:DUF2627 family protein [Oscillospiraceae bacterium]